jgi:uncharacterized protein YecE (DUF72 family)
MDFGKVDDIAQLDTLDFTLPEDTALTKQVLKAAKKPAKPNVYVGCAKWGRPDWVGKIYPKGTKAKDFLEVYARQFNSIEYNAIFYKLPTLKEVENMLARVDKDFIFCPKFTNTITHLRRLKNTKNEVDQFLETINAFGKHLGPTFLMPHPQMGLKHFDTIKTFLEDLPRDLKFFLELRHPEWYAEENLLQILNFCKNIGVGTIITDTAGRRECVHMHLTTPDAFIRFVGNSLHASDYTRIDEWVERIKEWIVKGIQNIYFFMHQHDELYSPELAKYLIIKLNDSCGLNLKVPEFVGS